MLIIKNGKSHYMSKTDCECNDSVNRNPAPIPKLGRYKSEVVFAIWKNTYKKELDEIKDMIKYMIKTFDKSEYDYELNITQLENEIDKLAYKTSYNTDKSWAH